MTDERCPVCQGSGNIWLGPPGNKVREDCYHCPGPLADRREAESVPPREVDRLRLAWAERGRRAVLAEHENAQLRAVVNIVRECLAEHDSANGSLTGVKQPDSPITARVREALAALASPSSRAEPEAK